MASVEDLFPGFKTSIGATQSLQQLKRLSPYNDLVNALSVEEQKELDRFKAIDAAQLYLVAHAMARLLLESYEPGVLPRRKAFLRQAHGKPFLADTPSGIPLFFNISHSWPWAVLAATRVSECGIDVEMHHNNLPWRELYNEVLHPREREAVLCAPSPYLAFFRYWTLKEAATKTAGLGLLWDFTSFAVQEKDGSVTGSKEAGMEITVRSIPCSRLDESAPGFLAVGCMVPPDKMPAISVHRFDAAEYGIETQHGRRLRD